MTKRGPLSKIEKSYIENNHSLGITKLAKELDRTEKQIDKVYHSIEVKKTSTTTTEKLMGKKEVNGKIIATVMTEGASMYTDSTREKRVSLGKDSKGSIFRPKG